MIEHKSTAVFVNKILNELNYNSKILKRDKNYMVYIKESEKISDFIKLLNAYTSLFYYEDMSVREIAESIDIKESTVKSHLHRGRMLLKNKLKGDYDFV